MTQSDIRVKSYCRLKLLRASVFNFELLDILRDSIRHPSKKLLSFEFAESFDIQFRASDILRDSIGHPSKKLLFFEYPQSFGIQF